MRLALVAVLSAFYISSGFAQGLSSDYDRAKQVRENARKVYNIPQQITWSKDGSAFAYRVRTSQDGETYALVNANKKS